MAWLAYDDAFLRHDTGPGHPESAERLRAVLSRLADRGLASALERLPPRDATAAELELAHHSDHIARVRDACAREEPLDADTVVVEDSWRAAVLAAGATLAAADAVMKSGDRRAFCAVRPPGHHATPDRAMGFCLFNSVAVCARYLQRRHGVGKVAILDFDVHHGNGTEDAFREDDSVFYLSIHRYPFYPGTGGPYDGTRPALANRNVPLPAGVSLDTYFSAWEGALEEVDAFKPEVVIVSAGFDAYEEDPIGGLGLRPADFRRLTENAVDLAERNADGRLISSLEGGYHLGSLGECVEEHLLGLDPSLSAKRADG